ncbi:MAG: HAD family hydrolase [Candidatus Andersenbacteria bacterium]
MNDQSKKVVFLDRDGPINVDKGFVYRQEDWEWSAGVFDALQILQEAGFTLTIITNQTAIAAGKYTVEDMQNLHEYMLGEFEERGINIAAIAFCPHLRGSDCECQKPRVGMAKQIEKEIGPIDFPGSWVVGDKKADLEFGKNIGSSVALMRSTYWQEGDLSQQPEVVVDSLLDAALYITKAAG